MDISLANKITFFSQLVIISFFVHVLKHIDSTCYTLIKLIALHHHGQSPGDKCNSHTFYNF